MPDLYNSPSQQTGTLKLPTSNNLFFPASSNPSAGNTPVVQSAQTSTGAGGAISGGTGFNPQTGGQGTTNFQNAFQQYANNVNSNPNFSTQGIKATQTTAPTYTFQHIDLPQYSANDLGNNQAFLGMQDMINKQNDNNQAYINSTYDNTNKQLEDQANAVSTQANSANLDLANQKANALDNTERNYNFGNNANNQLFQDSQRTLSNQLRGSGALDSSANDVSQYGSARNQLFNQFTQNQSGLNQSHDQSLNAINTDYTKNHNQIMTDLQNTLNQINATKNQSLADRSKALNDAQYEALQKLSGLKDSYTQAQLAIAQKQYMLQRAQYMAEAAKNRALGSGGANGINGIPPINIPSPTDSQVRGKVVGTSITPLGSKGYLVPGTNQVAYQDSDSFIDPQTGNTIQQNYAGPGIPLDIAQANNNNWANNFKNRFAIGSF